VQGDPSVRVVVTVTEAEGSRAFEVAPEVVGARPALAYDVDAPSVTVRLGGPLAELDAVDVADVAVELPVADLELGENVVVPTIHAPSGLSVVGSQPETVRVTVSEPA
jgi:hypothetical protein